MKNIKIVSLIILAVLVIIVALQNTETVETRILFMSLEMPRAMLLLMTMLVGVVLGLLLATRVPALKIGGGK